MSRIIILSVILMVSISTIKAGKSALEMYTPQTNIKMVDVIVEDAFWDDARSRLNSDAWFLKCNGPTDINAELNKKSIMKTIKGKTWFFGNSGIGLDVDFKRLADAVNGKLTEFEKTYNKENRKCTFTDVEFAKLKLDFETYASKLRKYRETLFIENPQSVNIPRILDYCTDMFENLVAIAAIGQQKTNWGYLTGLKKPGVLLSNMGYKFTSKKPKPAPKK
ncbi:uncharacterized protein LOC116346653 [Contarinia nasturtii]|uniref:uncharacterized protein LOC116346653 n=1 Tax=Contarinia nasturtii TaxID=265458 RepID=UPI0012D3A8EB|nr:uncharacterized protein LOC116346653 [Contarinia nasturtii]